MKFSNDTLYIWVGGSCDYGHKERAGGGAYIAECYEAKAVTPCKTNAGKIIDTYTCAEFETTEFRMMLKAMIHAMEKFSESAVSTKITFLSNVQYLLNYDKMGQSADRANIDLIEKCIELKHKFQSVEVKVVPYHKFEQQEIVHNMASETMREIRNKK